MSRITDLPPELLCKIFKHAVNGDCEDVGKLVIIARTTPEFRILCEIVLKDHLRENSGLRCGDLNILLSAPGEKLNDRLDELHEARQGRRRYTVDWYKSMQEREDIITHIIAFSEARTFFLC